MSGRTERADAARNRRAILAATERLLAELPPREISMERVAAAAGVGKGTVFHRFGSRTGLMYALMIERAQALEEAVAGGPPPLGPGARHRERLLAFLDAIVGVVARNKSLIAELGSSLSPPPSRQDVDAAEPRDAHPVYRSWHRHLADLIAAERPDLDADMLAHVLLGAVHSEPILAQLSAEGPERLSTALRTVAAALLE